MFENTDLSMLCPDQKSLCVLNANISGLQSTNLKGGQGEPMEGLEKLLVLIFVFLNLF